MPVDDKNIIDIVSTDKNDIVVLTISDHLAWDSENEHLLVLQDKINVYLGSIESHELFDKYPKAINKEICIRIVSLHEPNHDGFIFLERAKEIIEKAGYKFEFKLRGV
jgi:hypothetical protein